MNHTAGDTRSDNAWTAAPSVAANYERSLVPMLFKPWANTLVRIAAPRPVERVLDIACGTGIVARTVAARLAGTARITGIDVNADMLDIACRTAPGIDWRLADATCTGLPDTSFDVVLCQQGLQFLPDPLAALRDWHRVLSPSGRLVVSTWHNPDNPAYATIRAALQHHLPYHPEAAGFVTSIFALSDATELHDLLARAGFRNIDVAVHADVVDCPKPRVWVEAFLSAAPVDAIATLSEELRDQIITEVSQDLRGHLTSDGRLTFSIASNIAIASA